VGAVSRRGLNEPQEQHNTGHDYRNRVEMRVKSTKGADQNYPPYPMILLSNCRFRGGGDEFKAQGFRALLEIAHHAFLILALVVVLARVAVFRTKL
jgi:hypothetical protein